MSATHGPIRFVHSPLYVAFVVTRRTCTQTRVLRGNSRVVRPGHLVISKDMSCSFFFSVRNKGAGKKLICNRRVTFHLQKLSYPLIFHERYKYIKTFERLFLPKVIFEYIRVRTFYTYFYVTYFYVRLCRYLPPPPPPVYPKRCNRIIACKYRELSNKRCKSTQKCPSLSLAECRTRRKWLLCRSMSICVSRWKAPSG